MKKFLLNGLELTPYLVDDVDQTGYECTNSI